MRGRRPGKQRGFTLIEVVVSLALMGMASLAMFLGWKAGLTAWVSTQQFVGEQQAARSVVNTIARSLRMIGYLYNGTGAAVIYGGPNDVAFYADIDGDGTIECYHYYLSNGVVYQAIVQGPGCASTILTAPGTPITASGEAAPLTVQSLTFQYFAAANQGGAQLVAPLNGNDPFLVRRIDIAAQVKGTASEGAPFEVDAQAVVRAGR